MTGGLSVDSGLCSLICFKNSVGAAFVCVFAFFLIKN